jgi:hypothetical protein
MLLGERADGEDPVVAGGITVYRDLVAGSLGVRSVAVDEVGDAQLVVLCPDRHGPSKVEALAADARRKVIVLGVSRDNVLAYWEAGAYSVLTERQRSTIFELPWSALCCNS